MSLNSRYIWILFVAMLIAWGHPLTVAASLTLEFFPTDQAITKGTNAQVDVRLRNPGGNFLSTYDVFVSYDPAILAYNTTTFSNALGNPSSDPGNIYAADYSTPGSLELIAFPLFFDKAIQSGSTDLLLFSLNFSTLAAGTSALTIPKDPWFYLGDENGDQLVADVVSGSIVVNESTSPVPAPNSIVLLSAALLIFVIYKKRIIAE